MDNIKFKHQFKFLFSEQLTDKNHVSFEDKWKQKSLREQHEMLFK